MNVLHLIVKEITYRKLNSILSLLAIVVAVALFVSFFTSGEASKRETTRLMRDMGFNLRIIPKETDMDKFWATGYSDYTMPEEYAYRLASQEGLSYAHLTATLQKTISWRNREAILTGISPEMSPPDKPEAPMIFTVKKGTVYIGFQLAYTLGIEKGGVIDIFGESFAVATCLTERGSSDDIRIFGNLEDVQRLLHAEGRINEIMALECICRDRSKDSLTILREQLSQILPEARVIQIREKAKAREKQRLMVEEYFALILPFVLVVCAVWVGALAMMNTRERQAEIGIIRAVGYGSGKIALLFLGKAIMTGAIGAALGFGVGTALALRFGSSVFEVTANAIKPEYGLLGWSLLAAPAFAALSSLIPAMIAVTQDPAVTLREE